MGKVVRAKKRRKLDYGARFLSLSSFASCCRYARSLLRFVPFTPFLSLRSLRFVPFAPLLSLRPTCRYAFPRSRSLSAAFPTSLLFVTCFVCLFVPSSAPLGSPGLSWAPLGSPGLAWALLGAPGSSGLSWMLLCSSGLVWALLGSSGLFWALLGWSGLSWPVLGSFGLHWARMDSSMVNVVIL